jgi:parallel beta-helix repeat protein
MLVLMLFFAGALAVGWHHAEQTPTRTSYITHPTISITGNAQLMGLAVVNNWTGNGSADNPYIIGDYDIDGTGFANAISIQGTTLYFVIQNCYLHDATSAGIYFSNVIHAELIGDVCSANRAYGISLSASTGISIFGCDSSSNVNSGILISSSGYTRVENSTFSSNQAAGIYSESSENLTISNNTCASDSSFGIYLYSAANSLIANNICTNNYNGIWTASCANNVFIGNTCTGGSYGIYTRLSDNNALSFNNCSFSSSYGIWMDRCVANTVRNCSFWSNSGYGVFLDAGSMLNKLSNNTFAFNNGVTSEFDPLYVQARDVVGSNSWNSAGSPHGWGNYWNDWTTPDLNSDGIVDDPYALDGGMSVKDNYPLTSSPTADIPEFGSLWLLVTVFCMLAVVFLSPRVKKF